MSKIPRQLNTRYQQCLGFTIIELLVSIVILTILVALLLPIISSVRDHSKTNRCKGNLKQIGIGIHVYANDKGIFPYSRIDPPMVRSHFSGALTTLMTGVAVQFDEDNEPLGHNLPIFECPDSKIPNDEESTRFSHYSAHQRLMPAFIDGKWTGPPHKPYDIPGASEKILIADGPQSHMTGDLIRAGNASPSFWKTIYPLPGEDRLVTINDPIDESGNKNTDHNSNRGYFRYRHLNEDSVNALFVDGHSDTLKRGTILNRNIRNHVP